MADPLPFDPPEYEDRLEGLREAMEVHGLDACVLTSPANLAYYAGLSPADPALPDGLVVTRADSVVLSELRLGRRRGYGTLLAYDDGLRDEFWHLAASVAGTGKAIGCEADHLTLMQSERLNGFLKPRRGVDIALATMQQRMVKSGAEIALLRLATAVAGTGLVVMQDAARPGASARDIARAGRQAREDEILSRLPEADSQGTTALVLAGPGTEAGSGGRHLRDGDLLALIAAPVLAGYAAPVRRMAVAGAADPAGLALLRALQDLADHALSLVTPGVTCGQVAQGLTAFRTERQMPAAGPGGYGPGLPGEPLLALRADCETVLEPGMVLCLSPAFSLPKGQPGAGLHVLQDLVLVTGDGCEPLSWDARGTEAGAPVRD